MELDAYKLSLREVKEVPEDSDEAKKWPRWPPVATTPSAAPTASSTAVNVAATPDNPTEDTGSKVGLLPSVPSSSSIPSDTLSVKLKRRPGPRKSKILDISSSSGPAAKKLTTLDKSLMDWRSHVTSQDQSGSGLKDELEANRRGGGYLEKVEFLQRVGERKEEALEASKSTKRRRPL